MPLSRSVLRNGELIPPEQASIPVFSPALYGAYGVYESMQVVNGAVFALQEHLKRLARSAAILNLPMPADPATFSQWIARLLADNRRCDGPVRCTVRLFVVGAERPEEVVAYIWLEPEPVYPAHYYQVGAPAITFEGQRFWPQSKSLNSLVSYVGRRQAQAAGAHEALLHHNGYLTEGTNTNLFAVTADGVLTPPADQVLSGVTRDILLALAPTCGIPILEKPLALKELPSWRECFITSTSRHVMPVTLIDGRPVSDGRVGPLTRRLMAAFEEYFARQTAQPPGE